MRFVFFYQLNSASVGSPALGIVNGDYVVDVQAAFGLPEAFSQVRSQLNWIMFDSRIVNDARINQALTADQVDSHTVFRLHDVQLTASPPPASSLRDFYGFEHHITHLRRGQKMISEWYDLPVFHYANPQAVIGPDEIVPYPRHTQALDFEFEVAAIIGRTGRDIPVQDAESYILGYTIMNDWTARDEQRKEMLVGFGPAKAKDFATSLGPWIVTPDELEERRAGKGYDLSMVARRNGREISRGNWRTIYWGFADMIARASEDCTLYPGDVIGSGPVDTGCILEVGVEKAGGWLQPGDVIELEIERLGVLRNTVGGRPESR